MKSKFLFYLNSFLKVAQVTGIAAKFIVADF